MFYDINIPEIANFKPGYHFSNAMAYRIAIPILVSEQIEKIIYLDSDIVVTAPLDDLWKTDISDVSVACVLSKTDERTAIMTNSLGYDSSFGYFNSGVLLINIRKWREKNITEVALQKLDKNPQKYPMGDQDVLNEILYDDKEIISNDFNFVVYPWARKPLRTPAVIHYITSAKPWYKDEINTLYIKEWRDIKEKSLWAKENLRYYGRNKFFSRIKFFVKSLIRLLGIDIIRHKKPINLRVMDFLVSLQRVIGLDNRILTARLFFLKNKDRVKKITDSLADFESKETFKKVILWRQWKLLGEPPFHGYDGYFTNDFFRYKKDEVFIDCGAYTGDTIENYLKLQIEYKYIIAFEPDLNNFQILKNNYGENPKIRLVNADLHNKEGVLYLSGSGSSCKSSETSQGVDGEISIKVCSIDGLRL
jgi:lipopolysaccharide biosynthesis glycosyltransferase